MALFENKLGSMSRGASARRAIAVSAAFIVLIGCGGGGGGGGVNRTFQTGTPTAAELTGTTANDVFTVAGDNRGDNPDLAINGVIDGAAFAALMSFG